ncbi:MAG: urate oxidase [Chloracidobacterium sp.]|nr:urate oxidase [Chloracidobacterium sp.]MBK8303006.1 urate oxidase [Chloracidobacterium sp.]
MPVKIVHDNYGKSRVRLMKVERHGDHHELQNINVKIALEGDFDSIHIDGDNAQCLPTDTMKNTVYALAAQTDKIEEIECFGLRLARHFLANNPQVSRVSINIIEHKYTRIPVGGEPHEHSFTKSGGEKRTTSVLATREGESVESGLEDLTVIKTTKSGFAGFMKDKYTFLPEVDDRIFCTSVKANWRYSNCESATEELWNSVRQTILETFATHDSLSVQHTLYAMGEAVLSKHADVSEIAFSLPNIHCLPVDVTRFGEEEKHAIFLPTEEPHGLIEARLSR